MGVRMAAFSSNRCILLLAVIAGSAILLEAAKKSVFSVHEKAYYADPQVVEFVRPGLVFSIVSANVAADGTISVDYTVTDPSGAPLDAAGIVTPGAVSVSYLAAYIPKGQEQFSSYITRISTAATGGATATQAAADSGGTIQTVATGEYIYTFKTKAPSGFDPTATHRIGLYGSRNLTEWDLGTNYADTTFDFVPSGTAKPAPRDEVHTADCNA